MSGYSKYSGGVPDDWQPVVLDGFRLDHPGCVYGVYSIDSVEVLAGPSPCGHIACEPVTKSTAQVVSRFIEYMDWDA